MSDVATRSRWAGRGLLVAIAAIWVLNAAWIARHYQVLRPMTPGDIAPDFSLSRIDHQGRPTGEVLTLSKLRGQVVVLDFWAAWCGPCREAMPLLEQIYASHRARGLVLLSIKTDGPELARVPIIAQTTFPILVDDESASARYRVTNLPHVVVLDRRGVVRFVHRGGIDGDLAREVAGLLDEPASLLDPR